MTRDSVRLDSVRRVAAATAGGAVMALAFPPHGLAPLVVPGLALFVSAFADLPGRRRARRGVLLGLLGGAVHFLVLLTWLRVLGIDAWIALSLACAAFWAALGAGLPALLARRWWPVTVALAWVVMEAARVRVPWGGFPWGRLAFSQADSPLLPWAALGGPAMLSFAVALCATCLLAVVRSVLPHRFGAGSIDPGPPAHRGRVLAAGVVVPVGLILSGWLLGTTAWGGPVVATQPIGIVQGNVPRLGLDFNAQRRAVLDNHVAATEVLAEQVAAGQVPAPVAVIWPENSSDINPLTNPDAADQIERAADAVDVPILVGAVLTNPGDPTTVLNVSLVWEPGVGPVDTYAKRHPVPFGEFLPLRPFLTRLITRFDRIPRDFAPGTAVGRLDVGPVPAAVVICFEVAEERLIRDAVAAGGQVLLVQTNNATYGLTGQPEQQLAITRVQAVVAGRATLVAATSGISAVIDSQGTVLWRSAEFTPATTVADVPLRRGLTPAVRVGGFVEPAAVVILMAVLGAQAARRRRATHAPHGTLDQ